MDVFQEIFEHEKLPEGLSRISSEISFIWSKLFVVVSVLITIFFLIMSILKSEAVFIYFSSVCFFICLLGLFYSGLRFYDNVYIDYTSQKIMAKGNLFNKTVEKSFFDLIQIRKKGIWNKKRFELTFSGKVKIVFKPREKGLTDSDTLEELNAVSMIVNKNRSNIS